MTTPASVAPNIVLSGSFSNYDGTYQVYIWHNVDLPAYPDGLPDDCLADPGEGYYVELNLDDRTFNTLADIDARLFSTVTAYCQHEIGQADALRGHARPWGSGPGDIVLLVSNTDGYDRAVSDRGAFTLNGVTYDSQAPQTPVEPPAPAGDAVFTLTNLSSAESAADPGGTPDPTFDADFPIVNNSWVIDWDPAAPPSD